MTITLDTDSLRYIAALEIVSKARVADCICEEDKITYVVQSGQIGAAIGKGGTNVKKLTKELGKKIHIVELDTDAVKFTHNLLGGAKARSIILKEVHDVGNTTKVIVIESDAKIRGIILGKGGKNIEMIKNLLKRHHSVDDIIVR